LRGSNGADERVDPALGITLSLLHHELAGDIFVGADRLNEQDDPQHKTHGNEGLKQQEFFLLAGHVGFCLAAPSLYTYTTLELSTELTIFFKNIARLC
jgi:hypothetical protein